MKINKYWERDSKGKFSSLVTQFKQVVKSVFRVLVFSGMGVALVAVGYFIGSSEVVLSYNAPERPYVDRLKVKVEELKAGVIEDLAKCESGGKKEEDGIVILDSNNKGSYGVVQWQKTSYMHYYKMKNGKEISGREAIIEALDPEKAKALASFVIFETKNGVARDWVNCSKWHGLQDRVDMIKQLES